VAFYHILIRMACKAEVFAGMVRRSATTGKQEQVPIQLALCELYSYVETMKAFIRAAEAEAVTTESGLLIPNPTYITLGRIHGVSASPRPPARERAVGSGLVMALVKPRWTIPTSAPMFRAIWWVPTCAPRSVSACSARLEYTSESFGSRQLLFEMHNAGAQLVTQQRLVRTYDTSEHVKACEAARRNPRMTCELQGGDMAIEQLGGPAADGG